MPEAEEVEEKIKIFKNRRIPIVKFMLHLAAIVITLVVLKILHLNLNFK